MMDDLISRQAAIRWVKTECNPYGKPTLDFESGKKVIEHLKQMPSAQPYDLSGYSDRLWKAAYERGKAEAQAEQRWIPCNWHKENECLPDECKSVLICIKDKIGMYIDVSYRTDYNRWEKYGRNINVTAWMPLPEPYKEEGD